MVRFRSLPAGKREIKFEALRKSHLNDTEWIDCPTDWRAPFLPASQGAWSTFPALEELFVYNGSGVMPGRTWIIAPDRESLEGRWSALKSVPASKMDELFQPHLNRGKLGDRYSARALKDALHGFPVPGLIIKSI